MSDNRVEDPGPAIAVRRSVATPAEGGGEVIDLRRGAHAGGSGPVALLTPPSVRTYRDLHELSGGPFPQVQGLLEDDVVRALDDPRTIVAELGGPRGHALVPLLTPIDLVEWYSPEFRRVRFGSALDAGVPMWHLSTFPAADDDDYREAVRDALARLRAEHPGGVVVFADHAERDDDPSGGRLTELLTAAGAVEADLWDGGPAREHYFAGEARLGPGGRLLHDIDLRTSVAGSTRDEAFLDEVWSIYERPFLELAQKTPLRTYLTRDELREAIAAEGVIQVLHRVDDRLVSWLMMTTDIGSFPWMVAEAFYATAPGLPPERFHVFPGLVTDERFRGHHFTDRLVTEVAYALEQRGDAHVILFETLDENVGFLPELIEAGVAATGYGRLAFEPVGVQVHRAWELP